MSDGGLLLHGRRSGKCRNRNTCSDDEDFLAWTTRSATAWAETTQALLLD